MATNKDDSPHVPSTVSTPGQAGGFVVWIKGPSGPATTAAASALVEALAPTHRTALLEATDAQQALWPGCDMGLVDRSLHYIACLVARRGIACVVTAGSDPDLGGQTQHPAEVSGIQWLTLSLETGSRSPLTPDPDAHSGATVGGDSLRPSNSAQLSPHHETPDLSVCLETETPHTWIPRVLSLLTARRLWIPPCTPRQQRQQAPALPSVVVVQDWAQPPSQQLIRRTFGWRDSVSCVSATADTLPPAPHYVFDLDTFDSESRARALKAQHDGAKVTVVVKHVAPATAHFLSGTTWNVLPAYGDTEHIGYGTLRRAMRMACDGVPVVARGFLANSSDGFTGDTTVAPSYFVDLLGRMSRIARDGDAVVAAVVAPHRTGSQWLRDLLGWTVGSDVRVVHEHYIPSAGPMWSESWNLAEAVAREPDPEKQRLLRRAALRSAIQTAKRRYIFVTYRDPIDRVISYFIKRHSRFLRERLDPSTQMYLAPSEIQDAFDQWLPGPVRSHSRWFRTTLFDHFGLDVCDATPTEDGLLVAHSAPNTLVVVPTETLSKLEAAVEAAYGADTCAPLASDSALARGDGPITTAFRRQIHMHPAVATALRSVREAAYIRAHVSATTLG